MKKAAPTLTVEPRPHDPFGQWAYRIDDASGEPVDAERFYGTEGQARRAGANALLALERVASRSRRVEIGRDHGTQETPLDELAEVARGFLDLSPAHRAQKLDKLGHGVRALPINAGVDVLECRGERLEEIAVYRAACSARSSWRLSPRLRPRPKGEHYRRWFDRLKRTSWTAR